RDGAAPAGSSTPSRRRERPGPADTDRSRAPGSPRRWQVVIGGIVVVALLGVCGLSGYFMLADERQGGGAGGPGGNPQAVAARDISSRTVDPAPLTLRELFPAEQIVINQNEPAYQLLKTDASEDCRSAVTGEISSLLVQLGCSQVVRGTLRSPTGAFVVTGGIFNLIDAAAADRAHEKIKPLVDGGRGRFQGMVAGRGTEAITRTTAQVGWHSRGHFLVYCVIARVNGQPIEAADKDAQKVLSDVIELHLRGVVLDKRATAGKQAS
ncbi:hypothetical protein ACFQ0D_10730, partial [Micromonospora zhanjiangensis]